jgi:alpha-tubulin suppressor-like RCC1 family protein
VCAQVAAGENHSAALAADGRVFTWGRGKYGQLGLGDFSSQQSPTPVKAIVGIQIVQVLRARNTMYLSESATTSLVERNE